MSISGDKAQQAALGDISSVNGYGSNAGTSVDSAYGPAGVTGVDVDGVGGGGGSSSTGNSNRDFFSPRRSRPANVSSSSHMTSALNGRDSGLEAGRGARGGRRSILQNESGVNVGERTDNLWSEILNSVQSSRSAPTKNVIILGEPRSGKSTLLSHLASTALGGFISHDPDRFGAGHPLNSKTSAGLPPSESALSTQQQAGASSTAQADLALDYSYFDIGDADGEDLIGRVGAYQISSSDPANVSLLPFAISSADRGHVQPASQSQSSKLNGSFSRTPKSSDNDQWQQISLNPHPSVDALRDSMFVIVLDWQAPWTFLSQLVQWLDIIREVTERASGADGKQGEAKEHRNKEMAAYAELKEQIEYHIRTYAEPTGPNAADNIQIDGEEIGNTSTASAFVAVTNPAGMDGTDGSPLPEGSLTHNLGVPIAVVCTKADTIQQLEKQRSFKEEKFDYIQQVLRTICLKFGAALFFTAHTQPASFDVLREYILYRLFATSRQHLTSEAFAFSHRASTVDRDVLLVPAGWDSFGKIRALREGFDCVSTASGWDWDMAVERNRRARGLPKGSRDAEEGAERESDIASAALQTNGVGSAVKLYEDIVEDWDASAKRATSSHVAVKEPDDQAFLAQHYANLQREPETRGKMTRQSSSGDLSDSESSSATTRGGIVGPMGSSSLSLPSVERAMLERLHDDGRASKSSRRGEGRDVPRSSDTGRSTPTRPPLQSPSLATSERPTSPLVHSQASSSPSTGAAAAAAAAAASGGAQTPKQSEVLHSFFQSLLKDKAAPGSGTSGTPGRGGAARGDRR